MCFICVAFDRPASTYGSGTTGGTTGVPAATTKPLGRLVENVANADARHCRDPVKSQWKSLRHKFGEIKISIEIYLYIEYMFCFYC